VSAILEFRGREIIDSRGDPTVEPEVGAAARDAGAAAFPVAIRR